MKTYTLIGIIIVIGIIAIIYQGIACTTREKIVDFGPIQMTARKTKTLLPPPIVGSVALAGGIVLLAMGKMNKSIRIVTSFLIPAMAFILTFSACGQGPDSPTGNWGRMMGYGHGGVFMWFTVAIIVGVAIYIIMHVLKTKGSDGSITDAPPEILKKRYAKGDIDREEYKRRKSDLES